MSTTSYPQVVRDGDGRFVKGAGSPNPAGRPKAEGAVRDLARSYSEAAISELVRLMRESIDDRVRLAASVALLDRGWGRPTALVETGGEVLVQVINYA